MIPPLAEGVRVAWEQLPPHVREIVERRLGSRVIEARTQPGGFSPGLAARLRTADGQRIFVKAVSATPNAVAPRMHRREAGIAALLPPEAPAPRLLWSHDEGGEGWVILAFEDIDGRQPTLPWQDEELTRVLETLQQLDTVLTPSPLPPERTVTIGRWLDSRSTPGYRMTLSGPPEGLDEWSMRHLAALAELESHAAEASRGETLTHFDTRADNLLLAADRVYVVDWPHARVGQPWASLAFTAPSIAMQGGPSPDDLLAQYPAARAADPDAVTAVVAAVAGFFTYLALMPPLPGLPTLRAFQAAQGVVAREWLARRTGWR